MGRYIRIPSTATPPPDGGVDWGEILAGKVGGLARLGSGAANLAGFGGVGAGLSAVGGPLSLATGIASGNPTQAILGAGQTASTASGYLGGPTISSGLSSLYDLLPGAASAATGAGVGSGALAAGGALAEEAAALGIGSAAAGTGAAGAGVGAGLMAAAPAMLAAAPFAMVGMGGLHAAMTGGGDMFDSWFGTDRTGAYKKALEKANAPGDFNRGLGALAAGAGTLGQTGDTLDLLRTAQAGIDTRKDFGHNFDILKSMGTDVSGIEQAAPKLSGDNWTSWTQLMDRAANEGLDVNGIAGGAGEWSGGTAPDGTPGGHWTGAGPVDYRKTAIDVGFGGGQLYTDPVSGLNITGPGDWDSGESDWGYTTNEANDLSQAIYGTAMARGQAFDGPLPGATGAGGYLSPDQLEGFGLTPGHYEQGIDDYLAQMSTLAPWQDPIKKPKPDPFGTAWGGGSGGGDAV